MKFFYQIKLADVSYHLDRTVLVQNIVEKETKQDVLRYIESEYPEYFEGNKVAQKLTKKSEQIVYVTIFALDDYWEKYWTQDIECAVCSKKIPLIQIKQNLGRDFNMSQFTCSKECKEKFPEVYESKREESYEEYWSNKCDYYYIYKITNKNNGKCYIGYTEREPLFRWWEHMKHSNLPIGQAIKEHGLENFTFEVLEKHPKDTKSIQEMHEIETKYMLKYDSIDSGYNCVVSKSVVRENKKLF